MHLYFITPCVDISILLMHAHDHISQDTQPFLVKVFMMK